AVKPGKHAGSGACHACRRKLFEPLAGFFDVGVKLFRDRLAVIFATLPEKGAYCDGEGVPCQFLVGKDFCRGNRAIRAQHQVPGGGQIHRGQHLAHTLGPGAATADEHRQVGPQGQTDGGEGGGVEAEPPEVVETEQGGGGIGAAAAEAAPRGQALDEADIGAAPAARRLLEGQGGTDDQVVLLGNSGERVEQAHGAVVPGREAKFIALIQQLEEGLQIVIAVGAASGDVQEQVELGGGRQGDQGVPRSEEHTSELQSRENLVCRLLLEKKKKT